MGRRRYGYYDDYSFSEYAGTIPAKGGIKARSQRGTFGKNWWAQRWIEAMERVMDAGRLSRGRSYARRGQVLSIEETKTGVKARVQGSQRTPYRVTIEIQPLSDAQWEKVSDVLAEQALFAAQLLAGEMPQDIEEAFAAAGVSLFPVNKSDLVTDCSCPDWANPCKHVAATHFILGERFDDDPFLLFRLRGRSQEQILQAIRQRRAGRDAIEDEEEDEQEREEFVSLEETLAHFWQMGESLESFPLSIKSPPVLLPLLKRLGEPAFIGDASLQSQLGPAYQSITEATLAAAFSGDEGKETAKPEDDE